MISINILIDFFAACMLLSTFLMIGKVRLVPMLRYFALTSLLLGGLSASVTVLRGEMDFFPAIALVPFKVIIIPLIIYFTARKLPSANSLRMYLRPATTYILFAITLVISAIIVRNIPVGTEDLLGDLFFFRSLLFISVALVLAGILLIVIRKDLFSQVLGILTMENGIATFALVALKGIPLFLEMGIFLVIIVSTVILANLIDKVHQEYEIADTSNLNELID